MPALEHIIPKETARSRVLVPILETSAFLLLAPMVGWLFNPADPLLLQSDFPWLFFVCMLPALRYGFAYGFGSAMVLIGALALAERWQLFGVETFPTTLSLGLLIGSMLAGEFTDTWTKRVKRLQIVNTYQRMRLEEFTLSYSLLKVSHDRMEHQMAAGSVSLRGALMEFRRFLLQYETDMQLSAEMSEQILRLFGDYVAIRVAAIYPVDEKGQVADTPVAVHGQPQVSPAHEMVRMAVDDGVLMTIRDLLERPAEAESAPLAAVPIADVGGRLYAVLVVEDMPFVALQEENLKLLAVLGGHVADLLTLTRDKQGKDIAQIRFETELKRAILDCRRYALPAMLVTVRLPQTGPVEEVEELLLRQVRGLDRLLMQEDEQGRLLRLLMPLTGPLELDGWQQRINRILHEHLGQETEELGIRIIAREIRGREKLADLLSKSQEQTV